MKNYSSILTLLLRLRQAALHPNLVIEYSKALAELSEKEEKGEKDQLLEALADDVLRRLMREENLAQNDCPICLDVCDHTGVISAVCGHLFCGLDLYCN
jgi:hypothetical protein